MTNKNKIIFASVTLVLLGFYLINKNKNKRSSNFFEADAVEENDTLDFSKILSKGISSEEVKVLQTALRGNLVPDGIFGNLTEARLKDVTGRTSITLKEYNDIILNQ